MTKNLTMRKIICCMLMVMLMITLIPAQTANAAAKSYKAVEVTTSYAYEGEMVKPETLAYCQGMYFWMEFVDDCDGMYPRLWCSHDKTGKGEVLLADSKDLQIEHELDEPGYVPPQQIDTWILSNGSYVYFIVKDTIAENARLYQVMCDGRGLTEVAAIPHLDDGTGRLLNYYDGQIYYYRDWDDDMLNFHRDIYSISVKTGKTYKRVSDVGPFWATTKASTRYIACHSENPDTYWKVYIYDCKEKTKESIGKAVSLSVISQKLHYGIKRDDGGYYIYKEALSGRGKRTRVTTLKSAEGLGQITSKYVYWYKFDSNYDRVFYRYNMETQKSSKISQDKFKEYNYTWY